DEERRRALLVVVTFEERRLHLDTVGHRLGQSVVRPARCERGAGGKNPSEKRGHARTRARAAPVNEAGDLRVGVRRPRASRDRRGTISWPERCATRRRTGGRSWL